MDLTESQFQSLVESVEERVRAILVPVAPQVPLQAAAAPVRLSPRVLGLLQ